MVGGLIGLLLGLFCGLALRPVLDAFVLWHAHEQDMKAAEPDLRSSEERDR